MLKNNLNDRKEKIQTIWEEINIVGKTQLKSDKYQKTKEDEIVKNT